MFRSLIRMKTTLRKTRGTVVYTDGNSVRLRLWGWGEDPVDIEYRRINTVSHLVKDGWIMGVSTGTFTVDRLFAEDESFSPAKFRSVGFSPVRTLFKPSYRDESLSRQRRVGGWIGTTLNPYLHTGTYGPSSEHLISLGIWPEGSLGYIKVRLRLLSRLSTISLKNPFLFQESCPPSRAIIEGPIVGTIWVARIHCIGPRIQTAFGANRLPQ